MKQSHQDFGKELAKWAQQSFPDTQIDEKYPSRILIKKSDAEIATLEMTPIMASPSDDSVDNLFESVETIDQIIEVYRHLRSEYVFEENIPKAMEHIHPYANYFIDRIFSLAKSNLTNEEARLIVNWVKNLDAYTCVKAIESLFYSKADLRLLAIAKQMQWQIHFDHLAIRCGNQSNRDAERIVEFLKSEHGYIAPQTLDQDYYEFSDGWNAYVLFKILTNGQCLLLFVDQSDERNPQQVIQHWNRVYGYTPHHLAIRLTKMIKEQPSEPRSAIPLSTLGSAIENEKIEVLQATGLYTKQMLEQVFTRPEQNKEIPADLVKEISDHAAPLAKIMENGKLLEIVSRKELPEQFKKHWFSLYGLEYESDNPLHSAPIYSYFLPAQAAHVIRTSIQTQ